MKTIIPAIISIFLTLISCTSTPIPSPSLSRLAIPDSVSIISWVTTVSDCYELSLLMDTSDLWFSIYSDKFDLIPYKKVGNTSEEQVTLCSKCVLLENNMIETVNLVILKGNDTLCTDKIDNVPFKGGKETVIFYPLTVEINFKITIDPEFEDDISY